MSKHKAEAATRPALTRSSMAVVVIGMITAVFVLMATTASDSDAVTPQTGTMTRATVLAPRPQALPTAVQPAAPTTAPTPTPEPAVVHRKQATSRSSVRHDKPAPTPPAAAVKAPAPVQATATAPAARTIRIAAQATPATMQRQLDRCIGAIQVNWLTHAPEIAQHSNCGGAWYARVSKGERINVFGGTIAGSYRVNGNRRTVSKGADSSVIDGLGDVVLQTCVGDRMVLVGLSRI